MEVVPFRDQYADAAAVLDVDEDELRRKYVADVGPPQRWLAYRGDKPVGLASARLRPDRRMFIRFDCRELSAYGALTTSAAAELGQPLHTTIGRDDVPTLVALRAAGFTEDFVGERFRIPFDAVLDRLPRSRVPPGFVVEPADAVDEGKLFTLDNTLRNDVPGTDGWRGDRAMFHGELTSSQFDRDAYLVAVDQGNGEYAGLVRVWRQPTGPHLGLIGVARQYRNTAIAAVLLRRALVAASGWGHDTFVADASSDNAVIYGHLERIGAQSVGEFVSMVRR